jgi:hypothetical protein
MIPDPALNQDDTPPRGLRRMRRLARGVLWFEAIWPAVAPAVGLVLLVACAALLDLPRMLPPLAHLVLLALFCIGVVALLGLGVRKIRRPQPEEADRRLEADSGLRHQPLAVLEDHPAASADASADTPSGALWAAHVARARAQIARLRLKAPRPVLAAIDRRALRGLVLIALVACLGVAGPDALPRLEGAFHPGFSQALPPPAPVLQAWITPPGYTGLPPVFLKMDGAAIQAPEGSKLTVSVTGGTRRAGAEDAPVLDIAGEASVLPALDATSFQIEQTLATSGRIAVRRQGREMAAWDLSVVANAAPVVIFPEPPEQLGRGVTPQTRLPWQVTHAYGVTALQAEIRLTARPDAEPTTVLVPLPGLAPKSARGARVVDLTAHPWAGLEVALQLVARDATGLAGRSEAVPFTLPERRFMNPLARTVVYIRRQLSLTPQDRASAVRELDRLSGQREAWDNDVSGYLNLRAIMSLLYRGRAPETVAQAQDRMWSLALHLEEGAADRTARALEAARQQLRDPMEAEKKAEERALEEQRKAEAAKKDAEKADANQGLPTEKTDKAANAEKTDRTPEARAEIEKRTRALEEALQKRLQALTDQARRDPEGDAYNPDAHPMDQRDMQRLAEEMKDANKKDKTDEAREKLAELEKMMEALKEGRPERGQMTERERQRAEKRQRGQQQMTALQDIIKREGNILDSAQARASAIDSMRQLPLGDPNSRQLPLAETDPRRTEQRVQLALRRAVGELMQQYADLTGDVPPNLGDADTAMRDGAQALGAAQDARAAQAAQRAIEALQKGGKSMQQQMASKFGRGDQQGEDGDEGDEGEGMAQGEGQGDGDGPGQGNGRGRQFGNRPGDAPGMYPGRPNQGRQQARRPGLNLDPLGRPRGEGIGGTDEAGDVQVPEEMEAARTRALQEELRRRGADRTRRQDELDYIERLLKQF